MSHNRSTMAQKEYVKAIVHNLSLQRFNDTEIVEFLAEKGIVLKRNTVNGIKKQIERQAEKWYIDLKQSRYKYIATYKERLDSLLSYQKILHDMITTTKREEIKIRAISELTSIEMNIFNIWKQLPNLDIVDANPQSSDANPINEPIFGEDRVPLMVDDDDIYGSEVEPWDMPSWFQCDGCKRWWRTKELLEYHKKRTGCPNTPTITIPAEGQEQNNVDLQYIQQNDDKKDTVQSDGDWKKLQCPACKKWFMNNFTLSAHICTAGTTNAL